MASLWLMFWGALLAATLLPGGSELLLVSLVNAEPSTWLGLFIAATLGNTLGGLSSVALGRLGRVAWEPQHLTASQQRALTLIERYGVWSLLLSWVPVVGDLLCLCAGWLKLPLALTSLLIFIGKAVRYGVILLLLQAF